MSEDSDRDEILESRRSNDNEVKSRLTCCSRYKAEWKLPWFGRQDTNGKKIDVDATFSLRQPCFLPLLAKAGIFGWIIQVLIDDLEDYDHGGFWLAYLTHWGLVLSLAYMTTSLLMALLPCRPSWLVNFVWGAYSVAAVFELVVVFLYWLLEYDPETSEITYLNIMKHGGIFVLVVIDGAIISRVPVRLKHLLFVEVLAFAFLVWTLIHSATDIGNPSQSDTDPDTDDDAIYSSLNWKEDPARAAITSVVVLVLVVPLFHTFIWVLSIYGGCCRWDSSYRRYLESTDKEEDDEKEQDDDDEEQPQEQDNSEEGALDQSEEGALDPKSTVEEDPRICGGVGVVVPDLPL